MNLGTTHVFATFQADHIVHSDESDLRNLSGISLKEAYIIHSKWDHITLSYTTWNCTGIICT